MNDQQSLSLFIDRFAVKIAVRYPNNCADVEDYKQAGHLKLAEMRIDKYNKRDFRAYAIITISRAMRETALQTMCAVSAPNGIKRLVHTIDRLTYDGQSEQEVCRKLGIDKRKLTNLKALIYSESWHQLFCEPKHSTESFSFIVDILLSCGLTDQEKTFVKARLDDDIESLNLTPKQRWLQSKNLRPKLTRSGYGI